jgi:response regulator RpfG family c-di-GMP phosphodiesterase
VGLSLNKMETEYRKGRPARDNRLLASARDSLARLSKIVGVLDGLTACEYPARYVPNEINLDDLIRWTVKQVLPQAWPDGVSIDVRAGGAGHIIVDSNSLSQALQYLFRAAVATCKPGDTLQIENFKNNDEFVNIRITNPKCYYNRRALADLRRAILEGSRNNAIASLLFPAKLLIQGLGGNLEITSKKGQGVVFTVVLPVKWQSWMSELNTLAFTTSVSRKQARDELEKIQQSLQAFSGKVPATLETSLDNLGSRVQEMAILCNRSLYLVEDFSSRLERQQERWLQQETERFALLEAVLATGREMAGQMQTTGFFFDVENARRVAKIALNIANEFNMSPDELKDLHLAALLKDLGLAISAPHLLKQDVVQTTEAATIIRTSFSQVWKALSVIPFLSRALFIVIHRNEKFDGSNGRFGIKGVNIPLGARILAVADAFESALSGLPDTDLDPNQAVKMIMHGSGTNFDPDVVNALLRAWKRKKLNFALVGRETSKN